MKRNKSLSDEMKKAMKQESKKPIEPNWHTIISTGSTLLDLAISGGVLPEGGLPGGMMVEIFGPSGSGKTVLLSEIGGGLQRKGGEVAFFDPEARLNKSFASMFDLDVNKMKYETPDTIPELFLHINKWQPKGKISGVLADSLAALSTNIEMENDAGDKMGMRRAKEFSEALRKNARIIKNKNILMVCSNQIRTNADAGMFGKKFLSPGGHAIEFYSSVRLRTFNPKKIKEKISVAGKTVEKVIGVDTEIEVEKNSIDAPYRKCKVRIIFDYGIDDIATNLQFIKDYTTNTVYMIGEKKMGQSLEKAVERTERDNLEGELKKEVIELWNSIQSQFKKERKKKIR